MAYRRVNEIFADNISSALSDGDQVWIHDYHLMLLPSLLRQRARKLNVRVRIGWFLHTPFPGKDFLKILPFHTELLKGILGADVIGFHTNEGRRNFLSACPKALSVFW